jgi:Ni2+-binding GTPase involved in maturation of urease and hydrogenase
VIDNLMGIDTPKKIGQMLKFADIVVITKADIVSQAEREVFAFKVQQANPRAKILHVNGITGQGAHGLVHLFQQANDTVTLNGGTLRFTMPAALCSYCLGETKIGGDYQMGNIKKIKI